LATAHSLPELRLEDLVELQELDQMLEMVADYFAEQLEQRIEVVLYRAYVEQQENLPVIRGRLQIAGDIRTNYVLRHRSYCRYTELTWDVPDNQVLRYVAHRLSGWPFSRAVQTRLQQLDRRMDEVSLVPFRSEDLDRFVYTRLNAGYEPLHRLCRLFLDDLTLSEEEGEFEFSGFLLDINRLFEEFVVQ